jgi:hypothetical protein
MVGVRLAGPSDDRTVHGDFVLCEEAREAKPHNCGARAGFPYAE